jgi:uncharacterized protein (TIGR00297 family)
MSLVVPSSLGLFVPSVKTALVLNTVLIGAVAVKGQKALTQAGLFHAWILGIILWSTLGGAGWLLCVIYLICGVGVTKVGRAEKEALGIAEGRGGMRGPENLWGSAAAGALCALAAPHFPMSAMTLQVGYVASLATKLSDTFASEIGKAYGRTTYLITTLKPVPKGTEGAVSLEGTLAGVVGSVIIALAGWQLRLCGPLGVALSVFAALVATTCESLIGATVQGKVKWMTNELVNFINTAIGATFAIAMRTAIIG